jgi:GNAT superfamily N-acetyltransferase
MSGDITYRFMRHGEEQEVCDLIDHIFRRFVAPEFAENGVQEFYEYASPEKMSERLREGHFVFVSEDRGEICGVIEMRDYKHISLLFVNEQGRGIAKELFCHALKYCIGKNADLKNISVHASSFAVPFYKKLGFHPTGPKRNEHGILFIPMEYKV